jgi:hypothetical protein
MLIRRPMFPAGRCARLVIATGLALASSAVLVAPALAQPKDPPAQFHVAGDPLSPGNAGISDQFATAVSVSGATAVVGAWLDDNDRGLNAGSAYVYTWDGHAWSMTAKLSAPDGAPDDRFGQSVAIVGDLIVVGAPLVDVGVNADAGAAYVYRRDADTWRFEAKLVADDAGRQARFGRTVAASSAGIAVGAPREDLPGGLDQGAVYTFSYQSAAWVQSAKLIAPDADSGDMFGFAIAMHADTLAVGAQYHDAPDALFDAGAAYVFVARDGVWSCTQSLTAAAPDLGANFGSSLALDDQTLVVGAEHDTIDGVRSGAAFVLNRDQAGRWVQSARLTSTQPSPEGFFGSSVGVCNATIVVGAEKADVAGLLDTGSAQAFTFDAQSGAWSPHDPITPPSPHGGEFFGAGIAFADGLLVLAAPMADIDGVIDAGAAFAYINRADCNADGLDDFVQIAEGDLADVNRNLVPDVCECLADWDASGDLSSSDVAAFVNDWFADQAAATLSADINRDGIANATDLSDFTNAYFEGCF